MQKVGSHDHRLGYTRPKSLQQDIRKGRMELSSTNRSFNPQVELVLHGSLSSALKVF